ncbi:ribonuclease III [Algisphaera agarilytica]|uniref:Ribonuclease 3 n=1 Tax=Algisphaera agarilytica TaxID=1385975 RepID=A0A7X0H987_9BACT|nr:ribonuclease III [Algisphaera agarilytica]MBB6431622.1 ribonuclease-3 [Algisphaera agarilytica]
MPEETFDVLGYRFNNTDLLEEALTHASSADDRRKSNERMEFLGDAILGYVVCEYLYQNFPDLLEGDMTKIKSAVVSRRVCAEVTIAIKLDALLNLGKGMSGRPSLPASVAAAVLESIIAAIYLDGGMEAAKDFIVKHMEPYIHEAATSRHQQNFKSVLQQLSQKLLPCNPTYILLDEKGPDHAKAFEVCIEIEGRRFSSAWANSKKQAEQQAALNALTELGLATKDEQGLVHLAEGDELPETLDLSAASPEQG